MTAKEYLLDIGFDDAHLPELFNNDDKSYYQITELMEEYHQAQLKLLSLHNVVGQSEQLSDEEPEYCNKHKWNDCECTDVCRRGLSIT